MLKMLLLRLGKYQDVIQVYKDKCIQLLRKHLVHEALESRWSIGNPERHNDEFKVAPMCPEGRLWNVVLLHGYPMITGGKVYSGEVFGLPQLIQQVVDPRQRVAVLDRLFVQSPIINAHAPPSILFRNKKDRGAVRALRRADVALSKQVLNLGL